MRNLGLQLGNSAAPARAAAAITIFLGMTSIIGWILGVRLLTSLIPGAAVMKINTAVGLVLSGTALLILAQRASPLMQRLAQGSSTAVFTLALATVAEYLTGRGFGIDEMLMKDPAGSYNPFHGRMSPMTATAFVAVSAALIVLPHRKLHGFANAGAAGSILVGAIAMLGYFWDATELVTDRWLATGGIEYCGMLYAARLRRIAGDTPS